eukprot:997123-Pyramimonas_sp.AAC.1
MVANTVVTVLTQSRGGCQHSHSNNSIPTNAITTCKCYNITTTTCKCFNYAATKLDGGFYITIYRQLKLQSADRAGAGAGKGGAK